VVGVIMKEISEKEEQQKLRKWALPLLLPSFSISFMTPTALEGPHSFKNCSFLAFTDGSLCARAQGWPWPRPKEPMS
jgi:hypothetical protein